MQLLHHSFCTVAKWCLLRKVLRSAGPFLPAEVSTVCCPLIALLHLRRIYSAVFTQHITLHILHGLGFRVWHCTRETKRRGKREKGNLNWSLVNLQTFSRMLTCSDQKHPIGKGPCSHKGRPLMLLPWLPRWPIPRFLLVYS